MLNSTVKAMETVRQAFYHILRSIKTRFTQGRLFYTQGPFFCALGPLFCALVLEEAIFAVCKRCANEGFACMCKENKFSPDFVEMATFLARNVVIAKLSILNQSRVRMRGLFHYSLTLMPYYSLWRYPRKGTYDLKNWFSDYAWFYKFLNWYFMGCNQKFFIYIIFQDMNYLKSVFERVQSGFDFFNRSPCKFLLLDRRSFFSNWVTHLSSYFYRGVLGRQKYI